MTTLRSCSWRHTENLVGPGRTNCHNCGHRTDRPRSECDCDPCTRAALDAGRAAYQWLKHRGADARLIAAAPDLFEAGCSLSTWAAEIKWSDRETNTREWLDGLKDRIERFQALARSAEGKEATPCEP